MGCSHPVGTSWQLQKPRINVIAVRTRTLQYANGRSVVWSSCGRPGSKIRHVEMHVFGYILITLGVIASVYWQVRFLVLAYNQMCPVFDRAIGWQIGCWDNDNQGVGRQDAPFPWIAMNGFAGSAGHLHVRVLLVCCRCSSNHCSPFVVG